MAMQTTIDCLDYSLYTLPIISNYLQTDMNPGPKLHQ